MAASIGISRNELLNDYYYDEFLVMLDAYNELHKVADRPTEVIEEVDAGDW